MIDFKLTGKTVLVTGGAGILGRQFCSDLLDAGARVALLDIDSGSIRETLTILEGPGRTVRGYDCDLADESSVAAGVAAVVRDFGSIQVLLNNAASKSKDLNEFFKPFEDFSLSTWREVMSVNLDGMFLMAKHVGRHMVERGIRGSIIQTASVYGVVAPDQRIYEGSHYLGGPINTPAVYSASKAGVLGLTRYLASYWGEKGIRVNSITPGGVESGQNETFKKAYSARVPLGRMATAPEMSAAVVFLASDASSYVTGQNLIVDGGLTVW